tara:strand:- start:1437 stop:2186 length:750 start_codon:yes stop_codon:yes gene_type:complete
MDSLTRYKISVISYLNSFPFIYGLRKNNLDKKCEISLNIPSVCADKLILGDADIALAPVVLMNQLNNVKIVSDYCIGANGHVDTVCLFSDVPFYEIENIFIDYQSRTSVELLKIILKDFWKISPPFIDTSNNYEARIKGKSAGLIIGDRAFHYKNKFNYIYDLSGIWKEMCGLPFVFACWITNKKIDEDFKKEFNSALGYGVDNIQEAIKLAPSMLSDCQNPYDYLNNKISYQLDDEKLEGMRLFLNKI